MFTDRLRIYLTERKKNQDITMSDSKFMQKSLGIIIILLFCFSGGMFFEQNLGAESQGRKIQSYVKWNCFTGQDKGSTYSRTKKQGT